MHCTLHTNKTYPEVCDSLLLIMREMVTKLSLMHAIHILGEVESSLLQLMLEMTP